MDGAEMRGARGDGQIVNVALRKATLSQASNKNRIEGDRHFLP
jgi:hypothetical protein